MEKKWEELSTDEKQEERFKAWLSPQGVEFASAEAEKSYKARVTRIKDAVQLKKLPDRVPVFPFVGFFPAIYAGITHQEAMYDYEKLSMATTNSPWHSKNMSWTLSRMRTLARFNLARGSSLKSLTTSYINGPAMGFLPTIRTSALKENTLRRMNMML